MGEVAETLNFATAVTCICFRACVSTIIDIYIFLSGDIQGFEAQLNLAVGVWQPGLGQGAGAPLLSLPQALGIADSRHKTASEC